MAKFEVRMTIDNDQSNAPTLLELVGELEDVISNRALADRIIYFEVEQVVEDV